MKCNMFSRNNKNTIVSTKRRCIFCFRKDYMQNWKEGNKSKNIIIKEAETTPLNIFPKIYVLFLPLKLSLTISNKSYGTPFTINKIGVGDGLDNLIRCLTPLKYFPIISQTKILFRY